jgi:hypothetical protein
MNYMGLVMQRFITASDNHEVILLATVQDGWIRWETFVEVPPELQQAMSMSILETIGSLYGYEARSSVADIEAELALVAA